ncbi:MAG: tRNA lysidine(34) synthetase TilS [Candidatus Omnitrophota bacterium]
MPIFEKFQKTILQYGLLKPREHLLLGVSGGADSLAMLFLFLQLRGKWGLKISVGHLDHGLRKDSAEDLIFVKKLCGRLGVPFYGEKIRAEKSFIKGSLEEKLRIKRQEFLRQTAKRIKATAIGLGHSQDDQAETVLMHLLRGSGLSGLTGISPKRNIGGSKFIRPLIEIGRGEIEAYLKQLKIRPREDTTNQEQRFFRNRIRLQLFPMLKKYNPNIKALLAQDAQIYAADYDYILLRAQKEFERCAEAARDILNIDLKRLRRLHPSLQRMALRLAVEKMKGDTRRLAFSHLRELEDLVFNRPKGSVVDLPQGIAVKKYASRLVFVSRKP